MSPSLTRRSRARSHSAGMRLRHALLALAAAAALAVQPAAAQSILRDAETEAFFRDLGRPLILAAKLDPASVTIGLVGDTTINAFATQGQAVYFNAGMIAIADNANQIEGVLAHELGHIAGADFLATEDAYRGAGRISLLSMLLGVAAMAAGGGEAGAAIMGAGQQAAMGKFLAFSRSQEGEADEAGASYLSTAGISGRGSVDMFRKLLNQEFRLGIKQDDQYSRSHPLSGDRIAVLEERAQAAPEYKKPTDPAMEARFQRIKAKLLGYVYEPTRTLTLYPESDTSVPARYARVYAFHKQAFTDKAVAEADALLAADPDDPYFQEIKGQILLESGRAADAVPPLRQAWATTRSPLVAGLLGHALISTERPEAFTEAKAILRQAIARDNQNPFAWYQLGIAYDRDGDEPRAALATAERYNLTGAPQLALVSGQRAMAGLPTGSPDWLRAQDIVLVSQDQMKDAKGRRRR